MRRILFALLALFALSLGAQAADRIEPVNDLAAKQLAWYAGGGEMQGFHVGGDAPAFVLTYQDRATSTTNSASYNHSVDLGAEAADRIIIAGVSCSSATAGAVRTVSTLTIGGTGGTARVAALGTDRQSAAIWTAPVPTGTTGVTVAVTWSGQCGRAAVSVWSMTGANAVPADTLADGNASADPTGTIDVPANGGAVAVGHVGASTTTTWTGLTERDDGNIETTSTHSAASDSFVAAQTGLTVTANFATNADNAMAVASFGP